MVSFARQAELRVEEKRVSGVMSVLLWQNADGDGRSRRCCFHSLLLNLFFFHSAEDCLGLEGERERVGPAV